MKRFKQAILSNFFIALDSSNQYHLVEANLDIESRDDRALCTEILYKNCDYQVLTNELVNLVCPICAAIMIRRINNMPQEKKNGFKPIENIRASEEQQLTLLLTCDQDDQEESDQKCKQFELAM